MTKQQKIKFYLHFVLLILIHFYVFWWTPVTGNMALYDKPYCKTEMMKYYQCMDFRYNSALRNLYLLLLLYLLFSSQQLAYGYSLIRKPSSVLQYCDGDWKALADIYILIPFVVEMRCCVDFAFSRTSMDVWQFFQLFKYNFELYACTVSNSFYDNRQHGEPVDCC